MTILSNLLLKVVCSRLSVKRLFPQLVIPEITRLNGRSGHSVILYIVSRIRT
jgi:hypothetical protein